MYMHYTYCTSHGQWVGSTPLLFEDAMLLVIEEVFSHQKRLHSKRQKHYHDGFYQSQSLGEYWIPWSHDLQTSQSHPSACSGSYHMIFKHSWLLIMLIQNSQLLWCGPFITATLWISKTPGCRDFLVAPMDMKKFSFLTTSLVKEFTLPMFRL